MPIEIRELVIRASVVDDLAEVGGDREEPPFDEIIDACVSEVLRILKRSEER